MASKAELDNLQALLEAFVSGDDQSIEAANTIEVAIEHAFPDNEEWEHFVSVL
jgi:hypothetical protein